MDTEIQSYYALWHYNGSRMQIILKEMFPCLRHKESVGVDSMACVSSGVIPFANIDCEIRSTIRLIVYGYIKETYPELIFECWMLYKDNVQY